MLLDLSLPFQLIMKDSDGGGQPSGMPGVMGDGMVMAETRDLVKKCMENAALVNYERLSEEARIEGDMRFLYYVTRFMLN